MRSAKVGLGHRITESQEQLRLGVCWCLFLLSVMVSRSLCDASLPVWFPLGVPSFA